MAYAHQTAQHKYSKHTYVMFYPIAIETASTWDDMAIEIVHDMADAPQSSPRTPEKQSFCFDACPYSSATGECGLITQHNEHRITFCLVWLCAGEHNKNNNGDLLFALPIASCGLKLDDAAVRVAVGLRLGLYLCVPLCRCGSPIDARGLHSHVGKQARGRSSRHHMPNDLVARAFAAAGVPVAKEPLLPRRQETRWSHADSF